MLLLLLTSPRLPRLQMSIVLNKQTLYLYNDSDPEQPMELAFQPKYGNIVAYSWYGEGRLMIGFSSGYLVVVSTHVSQIGQVLPQLPVPLAACTPGTTVCTPGTTACTPGSRAHLAQPCTPGTTVHTWPLYVYAVPTASARHLLCPLRNNCALLRPPGAVPGSGPS